MISLISKAQGETRGCVLVVPGGGYTRVGVSGGEGAKCAEYMATLGYDGYVLAYKPMVDGYTYTDMMDEITQAIQAFGQDTRPAYNTAGILGFSAGGQIASLYTRGPMFDFAILTYSQLSFSPSHNAPGTMMFIRHLLGAETLKDVMWYDTLSKVDGSSCRCLLYHSILDTVVHPNTSQLYHDALVEAGRESTFVLSRSGAHGMGIHSPGWTEAVETFLH